MDVEGRDGSEDVIVGERHIGRMRRLYECRREVLIDALRRAFGARVRMLGDAAGMHMVAAFASGTPLARGSQCGVQLATTRHYYAGSAPPNEFVFCFSALGERTIREGVRRLAARVTSER